MAVVAMQKIQAVVHQHDVDDFLALAQKAGVIEFTPRAADDLDNLSGATPHAELWARVQHAVTFLLPYKTKTSLLQTLREGVTVDLSEADVQKRLADTDAVAAIVQDVEAIQVELAEKTEQVRQLAEQQQLLQQWDGVENKLSDLDTSATQSVLCTQPATSQTAIADAVHAALADSEVLYGLEVVSDTAALITVVRADAPALETLLSSAALAVVDRPSGVEVPAVERIAVEERLAAARGELAMVHDQAEHTAHTHLRQLQVSGELLSWAQDRTAALAAGQATASTAVFTGWLMVDERAALEADLAAQRVAVAFTELPLAAGEEPPVEIKNNKMIQPFEAVTRLYGMPGYTDLDPTLFLAGFFFLFFGLSLTDVGYGATLAVISGGLLLFAKLARGTRSMLTLLFYIGIATVLVGALFGGYFGIDPSLLPAPLQALQQFDPIGNPLPVFYLALSLGVFQVMVGMLLKIYSDARNHKLADGLWEQGPWLFLFGVGIAYVLNMAGYLTVSVEVLVKLAYLGLGLLVLAAVRQSTGVASAVMNIGGSLYGSVGYLSDILSYSRLLALGLATTALAFAVNLIAGIVYGDGGIIGAVLAGIILIIGHVFTLAVNTLGAFIHSARLQFVEFFGKFVAGTGRSFAPLTRSEKHVTVAKE